MCKYSQIQFTDEILERFWDKVYIPKDENGNVKFDECMIYTAGQFYDGYGAFSIKRKVYRAHRMIYFWYYGRISDKLVIRHKCDIPLCVNPLHLISGTIQDNHDDCKSRNRTMLGSLNPFSVLTESDVCLIKEYRKQGYTQLELAERFNVARVTISDIDRGKTWKHI